jgi:hypothetical protein
MLTGDSQDAERCRGTGIDRYFAEFYRKIDKRCDRAGQAVAMVGTVTAPAWCRRGLAIGSGTTCVDRPIIWSTAILDASK